MKHLLLLATFLSLPFLAEAKDLLEANDAPILVSLHEAGIYQINLERSTDTGGLAVAGTYSSADRYGIEGLAIINGKLMSDRVQTWDGVMIFRDGVAQIFHKSRIDFDGQNYDLTDDKSRNALISQLADAKASLIQSHLLITDGNLDVRDQDGAPKYVRRIAYTNSKGQFGIYQSEKPLTLYAAAKELFDQGDVQMAFNLDMGAYDFCREWNSWTLNECGDPIAGVEALTNIIEVIFVP